jgi:hypothetical protein
VVIALDDTRLKCRVLITNAFIYCVRSTAFNVMRAAFYNINFNVISQLNVTSRSK